MNHLDALTWPRRTARLELRRATESDVDAVQGIRAIDGVSDWLTTEASVKERFDASFRQPERLAATLLMVLDGTVIGDLMFRDQPAWTQAEIAEQAAGTQAELGWVLDPAHAGHGYATEAVEEMLRFGFDELRLRRIVADCFADNEPSWRLMERVGMRREAHTVADALHRNGRWLDGYGYAILADEWRGRA